jgi:4-amino-4-deoxy-L-arabinose transferase-like glycosyltransferase
MTRGTLSKLRKAEVSLTLAVLLVAVAVRLIRLDHTPQWDEMYHVLAGKSWLANGTFTIADGQYPRAPLFTMIVGWFMGWFGEGLVSARLPSVIAGAVGVVLLFRFTTAQAGRTAGLLAAILLCFHPLSIYLGQLARFYALHAVCFWVGAYAVFQICERPRLDWRTILWTVLGLFSLVLAYQFQTTTVIGVGAVAIWAALVVSWKWLQFPHRGDSRAQWVLIGMAAAAAICLLLAWRIGFVEYLLKAFNSAPAWAEQNIGNRRYYARWFVSEMPALWMLFPIAVLIALRQRPRFAFFCTTVFAIIFLTHSLAAEKHSRFIFYGLPFFFAIWGIALAAILPVIMRVVREVVGGAFECPPSGIVLRWVGWLGLGAIVGFCLLANPAAVLSIDMLRYSDARWPTPQVYRGFADWKAAAETLKPFLEKSSVVLTNCDVKSLYFFRRSDLCISVTLLHETDTGKEFGLDPRTGQPVISKPESLAAVMRQHSCGLVVIEKPHWRVPYGVPDEIADYIEAHLEPVSLTPEWRLLAFRWQHQDKRPGSPANSDHNREPNADTGTNEPKP